MARNTTTQTDAGTIYGTLPKRWPYHVVGRLNAHAADLHKSFATIEAARKWLAGYRYPQGVMIIGNDGKAVS